MSSIGEVVPLAVTIRNADGNPMNAATVALTIIRPDLTTVAVDIVNPPPSTGTYTAEYIPTGQSGLYTYRWTTTEPALVQEGAFNVERPGAVGILSLAEAKELLGMQNDDRYDESIARTLRSATRLAERIRREKIMRQVVSETRDLGRSPVRGVALTYRPIIALTAVDLLTDGGNVASTLAPPDVQVDENGILTARSATALVGRIRPRYIAGYIDIPDEFREAVGYILQSLWSNRRGTGGRPRVGGQDSGGSDQTAEARSIPARAMDLLGADDNRPLVG